MTWLIVQADGTVEEREGVATADAIHAAVGGYFDSCGLPLLRRLEEIEYAVGTHARNRHMPTGWVHDEGRLIGLPLNRVATWLHADGDPIVGPLVISAVDPGGEEVGIPVTTLEWLRRHIRDGRFVNA